jgi:hypothetical protein
MVIHRKPVLRQQSIWLIGFVLASVALMPASASAQMFFASGSGGDGALSGEANFSLGTNSITISLSNLLSNTDFRAPGQALSDVSFTLSKTVSGTPTSTSTGATVNIDSHGNTTTTPVTGSPSRWQTSSLGGNSFEVTTLSGGQPRLMIAPSGTSYPNVNMGVKNFNSYYNGSATITITGITIPSGTKVSNVALSFGTGPDTVLDTGGSVPAPPSIIIAMTGIGMFGCAGLALSSRRRRANPA